MVNQLKILLVEEAQFFLAIEKQFLQKTPATLLEARDSDSAMAIAQEQMPDLIYMSYNLRPLSGVECARQLKLHSKTRNIPIIMICDQGQPSQVQDARRAGCSDVLEKPLDRQLFIETGRSYLPGIREPRQTCLFQIEFQWQDEEYRGTCLDLSSGGMFVDTQVDVPAGTVITLSFKLPNVEAAQIECRALVAWLNRRPDPIKPHYPIGFGLKFNDLTADQKALILRNIKR